MAAAPETEAPDAEVATAPETEAPEAPEDAAIETATDVAALDPAEAVTEAEAVPEVAEAVCALGTSDVVVETPMTEMAPLLETELEDGATLEADEVVSDKADDVALLADDELLEFEDDEEALVLFEELTATVQFLTSWTAGWPLESVIGVKVITQVCVRGPAGVMELVTVITVVGAERLAADVLCRFARGNALERFKNKSASKQRANIKENMASS